ncbi:MAG: tetratricopeptide repeat protein [Planctomycetes bacterium]|nr:tetratricopeptide repeat protein [Planctomycetota bacterium]
MANWWWWLVSGAISVVCVAGAGTPAGADEGGAGTAGGAAAPLPEFDRLWNFDDPAGTEAKFRELLPRAEGAGDAGYLACLLTQIARSEGLQRKFDAAHATLDRVEKLLDDRPTVARIRYLLERGRAFNSAEKPAQAKPLFEKAWETARTAGVDNLACDAAHMLGIVEPGAAGVAWNLKAMAVAEASSDPRVSGWLGALYNNMGWTYHDQGEYAKALELFEKGLAWREARKQPKETRIAKWTVGRALRSLGRVAEALAKQQALLEEWKAAGEEDGYVFEELGECLLALGRGAEARPHFAQAYELLAKDEWLVKSEGKRLERLKALAEVR